MRNGDSFVPVAIVLLLVASGAFVEAGVYYGMDRCFDCHSDAGFLKTAHASTVQGPPTETETGVLRTMIDGEEVSIFDPRTDGYDAHVAPWFNYFNEDNVAYSIGVGEWKQRFMTQVIPETLNGQIYSGFTYLTGNDFAVMGVMWNARRQRWEDYHGPLGDNDWSATDRLTSAKCGGCHATGFNTYNGRWVEQNSARMAKGISCESCHGPNLRMKDPRHLSFKHRLELCGACHSRGVSVAADGGPGAYEFPFRRAFHRGYEPGDDLEDFFIQSTDPDDFWPNGNAKRNRQQYNDCLLSKHADAEVGCNDCHTSHSVGSSHQTRRPGNLLCLQCHREFMDTAAYRQHSAHNPQTAKCIDCHMPYTAKSMDTFDIRSHTFDIIPPAETIAQGGDPEGFSGPLDPDHIPNSCNSKCHNGQGQGPLKPNSFAQMGLEYIRVVNGSGLKGDINRDGKVDMADLAILSENWGKED